jgi:hypothetical protein
MKSKAQAGAETPAWAVITTAEAMATRNSIMGFRAVELKRRFHDLPQLQDRDGESRNLRKEADSAFQM